MFQRENDIVILTTQRFASGEAIFIDCKSKRRDYTVVALIRLLFAARIHTTTKIHVQNWINRDPISCAWHK